MHYMNAPFTINNASTTTTVAVDASQLAYVSASAVFSDGTAAGSFKLQGSNDGSNWLVLPNTAQTVASGAATLIPITQVAYRWIRAAFVSTGGAGTIAVQIHAQGF